MARHLWSQPTSCASPPHLANTDWDKIGESKIGIWGFGMKIVKKKVKWMAIVLDKTWPFWSTKKGRG